MTSPGRLVDLLRSSHIHDPEPPDVDLSLMMANFTGGFGGLPQEIVDEILEYLEDDRRTLKACSLTCKGLFCSARRIIHRRLYVVNPGGTDTLGRRRYEYGYHSQLRTFSTVVRCGLACYTQELTIAVGEEFTPVALWKHLSYFQMFARLTSLTLHHFSPTPFLPVFEQYFGHLAQQMRSLEFIQPSAPRDNMMYFICQFPNLDDLGFKPFPPQNLDPSKEYNMSSIQSSPTLGGTLRIMTRKGWSVDRLECLTRLPSGLRFRSIEFLRCTGASPDVIIRECAPTLQSLMHALYTLSSFDLSACPHLRIFELHLKLTLYGSHRPALWLARVIETIASPVFSKFILVIDTADLGVLFQMTNGRDAWKPADKSLLRLLQRTGMEMIVRGNALDDSLCESIEDVFPLVVSAGVLEFEYDRFTSRTHRPVSSSII